MPLNESLTRAVSNLKKLEMWLRDISIILVLVIRIAKVQISRSVKLIRKWLREGSEVRGQGSEGNNKQLTPRLGFIFISLSTLQFVVGKKYESECTFPLDRFPFLRRSKTKGFW